MEKKVQSMIQSTENKGSPLVSSCPTELHNFVTKEKMNQRIREDLLNSTALGKEKYVLFRRNVYVDKTQRLSATIHRSNLHSMFFFTNPE